jgi:hypothetical protein
MRKPDKNFKMSNTVKNMLGGIKDKQMRNLWKKSFIQAQLAQEDFSKAKFKDSKGD